MGVVSRGWVWAETMGVASGCGCKEVYIYRFPHIIYIFIPQCLQCLVDYEGISQSLCSFNFNLIAVQTAVGEPHTYTLEQ